MASIDLKRFHRAFFEESFEGLDIMEAGLLRLDPAQPDAETLNGIFRAAHSIKGGAGTFGFSGITDYTHVLEALLDEMRAGRRALNASDIDLLLRATDALRQLLVAARDEQPVDAALTEAVHAELTGCLHGEKAGAAAAPVAAKADAAEGWRMVFAPHAGLFMSGNDPLRILRELATLGDAKIDAVDAALPAFDALDPEQCCLSWKIDLRGAVSRDAIVDLFAWVEDECDLTIEALAAASVPASSVTPVAALPAAAPSKAATRPGADATSIRVSTSKIDAMIDLVGELVITQAMLQQQASHIDPAVAEALLQGLAQLDRHTRLLQEAVMSTRMLPVDAVFSRFPRVVHDLAGRLGKQVRLQTIGESTELDKSVIEKIADPLTHLVRNSLDHGIESEDARRAAGKDPAGTLTLRAAHQGGHIVIEVADDGAGLDRRRILAKAAERGLSCDASMTDSEVWQLIFAPGFSTAAQVTDVSGRGVGMDVVKRNIESLGGRVEIGSQTGRGTCVTIRLPLTLAIVDGMSVAVGNDVFILPLPAIIESLQPSADQVKRVAGQGQVARVRDEYVPLVALHDWFSLPARPRPVHEAILVIVEAEGHKLALQVDALVGQQQVVIKSLETHYKRVPGVSGATILGDGRVALIADVGEIVRLATRAAAA
ncbi:chemotaxis protein CheA [Solimonas marina]|uniref:Chemotaxis protein CheA n=1 Tax=Solimonas marina TaxID=2714601 RepID=A0A969W7A3_9GAMM|nr:chemotaxis protein CheA [Solimonas marina]NKF21717.1 chemotaxis protein CheA [Solimonas marina]